jgi:multimeric flavodoxin WrbA
MKILGVSGSPRKGGNSDDAARRTLEALGGIGETAFMRIHDKHIKHCTGCRRCMEEDRCVVEGDDFEEIFDQWLKSDFILVSAPVYWLAPPGALKDFIDRSHGLYAVEPKPFDGKRAAVISIGADFGFDTHETIIVNWFQQYKAEVIGTVRLLARHRNELMNKPSELDKLEEFIQDVGSKLK